MMPEMLRSSCEIEVSYYPFDRQICSLKFISWSHNAHEINITTPYTDVLVCTHFHGSSYYIKTLFRPVYS